AMAGVADRLASCGRYMGLVWPIGRPCEANSQALVPPWYLGARSNVLRIHTNRQTAGTSSRVSEGTRTPDRLDHHQERYQLSYAHRAALNLAPRAPPGSTAGQASFRRMMRSLAYRSRSGLGERPRSSETRAVGSARSTS